jgi:hypothetical protein
MAESELIIMGESANQAEFNYTSDLLIGAQKHHGWLLTVDCWLLTVDCWLWVKKMKIARIISCELDSTLRPTSERGFDIIPAWLPEWYEIAIARLDKLLIKLSSRAIRATFFRYWDPDRFLVNECANHRRILATSGAVRVSHSAIGDRKLEVG